MAAAPRPRAVLVMARSLRAGAGSGPLAAQLGAERWARLQAILLERAVRWAESVGARSVSIGHAPGSVGAGIGGSGAAGRDARAFIRNGAGPSGELATAAARALGGADEPLLIAWPELPTWRPDHAEGALSDLADGCQLSIGPMFDGGFYLIALARPLSGLLGLPAATWRSADAMAIALDAAHRAGIEAGLVRPERGLRTLGDLRAALADPLLDEELRAVLEPLP